MKKSRTAAAVLSVALCLVLIPAAALAAANSIKITGSKHVTAGSKTTITISGNSSGSHGLAVYLDNRACSRKVVKEERRSSSSSLIVKAVRNHFSDTVTFVHSSAGTHYICGYLYHKDAKGRFVTDRHGGFKYVTS